MNRRILGLITLAGLLAILAIPVLAGTLSFMGTLSLSDPIYVNGRPDHADCSGQIDDIVPDKYHFQTRVIQVTVTGTYNFADLRFGNASLIDIEVAFYNGSFDPLNPKTNCFTSQDDVGTVNLVAGQQYLISITTWDMPNAGPYGFSLTGPGDVFEVRPVAAVAEACDIGAPAGAVLRTLPIETAAFYDDDPGTATGFSIPAGTWYIYDPGEAFTHLWVTCGANPVWVASSALQ
jgi:hypothetical protein